jgi:hypothetical protein
MGHSTHQLERRVLRMAAMVRHDTQPPPPAVDVLERVLETVEPVGPSPEVWVRLLRSIELDEQRLN